MDLLNADKSQIKKLVAELDSKGYNTSQKAIMAARIANAERGRAPSNIAGRITQVDVGKQLGVSRSLVYWAKLLVSKSSDTKILELIDRIEKGSLSLTEACKIAGLRQTRVSNRTLQKTSESELGKRTARLVLLGEDERWQAIKSFADKSPSSAFSVIANDIESGAVDIAFGYELFLAEKSKGIGMGGYNHKCRFEEETGVEITAELTISKAQDVLATVKNDSVDLILTDPPYNTDLEHWDKDFDVSWMLREFGRILRPGGSAIIFCSDVILPDYLRYQTPDLFFYELLVWNKTNPKPTNQAIGNITMKRYLRSTELILWYVKGLKGGAKNKNHDKKFFKQNVYWKPELINRELNGNVRTNVFTSAVISKMEKLKDKNGKSLHKTQKPEKLIESLLLVHSAEGDLVVDPFGGTGTTADVCIKNKRKYLGSEMSPDYVKAIRDRINTKHQLIDAWAEGIFISV